MIVRIVRFAMHDYAALTSSVYELTFPLACPSVTF
jgi:hypothetical protein